MSYFSGKRCVLCFSHDWSLLLKRQWLLERLGTAVISVMSAQEMQHKLSEFSPSIIVLCETLTSEESDHATRLVEQRCPSSRCIVLSSKRREHSGRHTQLHLDGAAGETALAKAIRSMLAAPNPPTVLTITRTFKKLGNLRRHQQKFEACYSINRNGFSRLVGDPLQALTLGEVTYRLRHLTGDPEYLTCLQRILERSGVLVLEATHGIWLAMVADSECRSDALALVKTFL